MKERCFEMKPKDNQRDAFEPSVATMMPIELMLVTKKNPGKLSMY
jgi:hypothetical protein